MFDMNVKEVYQVQCKKTKKTYIKYLIVSFIVISLFNNLSNLNGRFV